jgi:hypothetical protein
MKTERYVYYVDVGNLPKIKAEEYIKEVTENFKQTLEKHEKMWVVPVKDGSFTRIEKL